MKKFKKNGLIILIITVLLMYFVLKDNFNESIRLLFSSKLIWIFLSLVVYVIYLVIESIVTKKLIERYNNDYTLRKTILLTIMTKFFNGITPFATGGQPLQVYELNKEGVKVTNGTIVITEHFIIFQTSVVILALSSIIINTIFQIVKCGTFLNILAIIGFGVNIIILASVYLISINKSFITNLVNKIIGFLFKLRIVKDKETAIKKSINACNEYYMGFKELSKNKAFIIKLLLLETLSLLIWFSGPLFVFKALNYTGSVNILVCILISIYIFFIGSYIPIPGGSGGMEYAFVNYFNSYIETSFLTPALVIWRFINYYLPMIIGFIIFNFKRDNK